MGRLIREPLVHFLAIGAALFALYAWVNPQGFGGEHVIVVDRGRIAQLATQFQRTWNRPPTAAELDNLIDNFIVEEIFYRQALAMGLDKNDSVIRRRLRQKVEFITADAVALYEPTEGELEDFLQAHPEQFRHEAVYSFEQLYFSPDRGEGDVEQRAEKAREALLAGEPVRGDQSLLPAAMSDAGASRVDRNFGEGFAASLDGLPLDTWSEPLPSGLGLHLVRLTAREPAYLPQLDEVRDQVEREWRNAKDEEAKAALLARLKAGYKIVIERDDARGGG